VTVYYADFVNGNDADNGLGPDASHGSNRPWKTIAKALGAAGISSGDTVYLSPAGPFREVVTVAMTSAVAETFVLGDPWNSQGFRTAGGVLVSPGRVEWTAFLTNDTTAPSTTTLLNLAGRDFLTFRNLVMVGANNGTASCVNATTTAPTNIEFEDVAFIPYFNDQVIAATTTFGVPFVWRINRCYFGPTLNTSCIGFNAPSGAAGADYDVDVEITNCLFLVSGAGQSINLNASTVNTFNPGGCYIRNCTFVDSRAILTDADWSTSIPAEITNCAVFGLSNTGIGGGATGNVFEDWNLVYATTPIDADVTSGGNSVTDASYAALFNFFNADRIWGAPEPRPWMEPLKDSPALTFGNDGNQPTLDLETLPRPVTALAAVGAFGVRHNTFRRDTAPIGGGGFSALRIVGPGDYGFRIPVEDGVSYDISIDVEWDATYDDSVSKPQFRVDANPRIGVAEQVVTATGSSGSPETLTLSTITPSGPDFDFIVVRVLSRDADGGGLVQTDDLTIT
jgi:hypothetical protein